MSDYQSVVDRIQTAINISESTPIETLNALSQEYDKLCQTVNRRLADCNKFLQAGNLSEAIRLADTTPHLLDLCNLIEFPELDEWNDICRTYKLTVPPVIKATVIKQLNDGFELMFSLEPLLKRHRYLALTRAPLKERLDILYRLSNLEPENLVWADAIDLFEKERIKEIQAEIDLLPDSVTSLPQFENILLELESSSWREPPIDLRNAVLKKTKRFTQETYIHQFNEIAIQLDQAFKIKDLKTAQSLLLKWKNLLISSEINEKSLPREIRDLQNPVLSWVESCLQNGRRALLFQQKVTQFQAQLVSSDDLNELEILYADLLKTASEFKQIIPPFLQKAYDEKIQRAKKKKLIYWFIIALVFILFALFVVIIVQISLGQQKRLEARQKKIEAVNNYLMNYESALDKTDANSTGSPDDLINAEKLYREFVEMKGETGETDDIGQRLTKLQKKEEERVSEFRANIEKIRHSLETSQLDSNALSEAKKKVLTKEERIEFENLEKEFATIIESKKASELAEYLQKYEPLSEKVENLRQKQEILNEDFLPEIDELSKEIDLLPNSSTVSKIQQTRTDLINQLKNLKKQIVETKQVDQEIAKFQESIGDLSQYFYDLSGFIERFTQHYLSKDFNSILDNADVCLRILEWNDLVQYHSDSQMTSGNIFPVSTSFIRNFENVSSFFETTDEIQTVIQKIKIVRPHCDNEKRQFVKKQINDFLERYKKELWLLHRSSSEKSQYYYFIEKPTQIDQPVFCGDWDGAEIPFPGSITPLELQSIELAPQYLWAKESYELLNKESLKDEKQLIPYYQTLVQIFKNLQTTQTDDAFDPIIKLIITKKLIAICSQDPYFQTFLHWKQQLNSPSFNDEINWFNPESRTINEQRKFAQELLSNLSGWNEHLDQLEKQSEIFSLSLKNIYRPIGFLLKKERWSCLTTKSLENLDGELFIAVRETKIQLINVGSLKLGAVDLSSQNDHFLNGLPVFLKCQAN
ncbi:MAG: hypothetical protein Q4C95_07155 [Planctomycetia bacterium]|nr:hypothetical protein [Planctomycetia bacterium]